MIKLKLISFVIFLLNLPHIYVSGTPSSSEVSSIHSNNESLEDYNKIEEERLQLLIDSMKSSWNEQSNPCEKYLDYVGSAINKSANSHAAGYKKLLKEIYEKYIKNNNKLSSAESKLKNFFEHCENYLHETYEEHIANLDFRQFGHFPLIEDEWNEDKFDWMTTQAKRQLFPDSGFFDISAKNINGKLKFSIEPGLLNSYRFAVNNKHFDELFQSHGYSIEETTALQETFSKFEKSMLLAFEWDTKLNTTIGEMDENIAGVNWKKFFEIYSNGTAKDSDEVSIIGIDGIRSYIDILSSQITKRDLANYIFYDIYDTIRKGFKSMKNDTVTCDLIIGYYFEEVFANIMLNNYLNQHDTVNIIDSIESILKTYKNEIDKTKTYHLKEVVDILRTRTSHGPKIDDTYEMLNLTNNFVSNIAELTRYKLWINFQPISPLVSDVCSDILKFTYSFHDMPRIFIVSIMPNMIVPDISEKYRNIQKKCYEMRRFKYAFKVLEYMKIIDEDKFRTEENYLQKSGLTHIKSFFNIFLQYYRTDYDSDPDGLQISLNGLKEFTDGYGCPADNIETMENICDILRNSL